MWVVLLDKARDLLRREDSLGLVLSAATDKLTKGMHPAWEIDSLLVFLEDEGVLPEPEPLDRLLAVTAIRVNPAHQWDARVFENLSETLNGRIAIPESVTGAYIGEMCWTVTESKLIAAHYDDWQGDQMYGDDPAVYVAAQCASQGMVVLPPELNFAQHALDTMFPKSGREAKLREDVLALLKNPDPPEYDDDDAASVQARILMEAGHYVTTLRSRLREQLTYGGVADN